MEIKKFNLQESSTSEIESESEELPTNKEFLHHKKIKLDYSPIHFRGVFAVEDIEPDEIIERCPMVPLDFRTKYHKDAQIFNYLYTNYCPCQECANHGAKLMMVLGYGMIYNHKDTPNTVWEFDNKNLIADVVATMPIKAGEEIFVSYGENYFKNRPKVELEKTLQEAETLQEKQENLDEEIEINMPIEWVKWVEENIERGVPKSKIKDILIENNFEIETIELVLKAFI